MILFKWSGKKRKEKMFWSYYDEILEENPLGMFDFLFDRQPHIKQLQLLI